MRTFQSAVMVSELTARANVADRLLHPVPRLAGRAPAVAAAARERGARRPARCRYRTTALRFVGAERWQSPGWPTSRTASSS